MPSLKEIRTQVANDNIRLALSMILLYLEDQEKDKPHKEEIRRFTNEVHDIIFKAGLEALEKTARPWEEIKKELGLDKPDQTTSYRWYMQQASMAGNWQIFEGITPTGRYVGIVYTSRADAESIVAAHNREGGE